jgi:hypothetical protein
MLAFCGWRFQNYLAVSLNEGAECAWIALWILEAFTSRLCLVGNFAPPSPDVDCKVVIARRLSPLAS